MRYDLIIFDCDGTLIESERCTANLFSKILIDMGHLRCTREFCYNNFASYSLEKNIEFLQAELGHEFDAKAFKLASSRAILYNIENDLTIMPGAVELLETLHDHPKCIASNGNKETIIASLARTGLLKFFPEEHIFSYQQVGVPKPAPDLFLHAAMKMGVFSVERCIVIEDSDTGVKAANAAGMEVIVMRSDNNPRQLGLKHLDVKAYVDDLRDISQYIM